MKRRFQDITSHFADQKVLVVGDVMLDHYICGSVTRISPEAPVPIVEVEEVAYLAGGAANVAVSVSAMGASVDLVGVVGDDPEGLMLRDVLADRNVDPTGLRTVPARPTTLKTRVLGRSQQIVRLDRERRSAIPESFVSDLIAQVSGRLPEATVVIVSDYGKGVVSSELAQHTIRLARSSGIPVVVDPHGRDYARYQGASLIKPNRKEAERAVNVELTTDDEIVAAGWSLLRALSVDAILITRGHQGMTLFEANRSVHHLPTACTQAIDPTGAGDVVSSAYALALGSGASHREAVFLANQAAALACRKIGASPISLAELQVMIETEVAERPHGPRLLEPASAVPVLATSRPKSTNGRRGAVR